MCEEEGKRSVDIYRGGEWKEGETRQWTLRKMKGIIVICCNMSWDIYRYIIRTFIVLLQFIYLLALWIFIFGKNKCNINTFMKNYNYMYDCNCCEDLDFMLRKDIDFDILAYTCKNFVIDHWYVRCLHCR